MAPGGLGPVHFHPHPSPLPEGEGVCRVAFMLGCTLLHTPVTPEGEGVIQLSQPDEAVSTLWAGSTFNRPSTGSGRTNAGETPALQNTVQEPHL